MAKKSRLKKKDIGYGYNSVFPMVLRGLLDERGITQEVLAERLGIARQSISQWQTGKTKPDIHYLEEMAQYFGVSTDYLLGITNIPSKNPHLRAVCDFTGLSPKAVEALTNNKNTLLLGNGFNFLNYLIESGMLFGLCTMVFSEISTHYLETNTYLRANVVNVNDSDEIIENQKKFLRNSMQERKEYNEYRRRKNIEHLVIAVYNELLPIFLEQFPDANSDDYIGADYEQEELWVQIQKMYKIDKYIKKGGIDNGNH